MTSVAHSDAQVSAASISPRFLEKDAELARLTRCEAQFRLRMGELLDALFELGGHHELGFSSFDAYVAERCDRSGAWGRETRALANHLREKDLQTIRKAILSGQIGASMAELLARHATRKGIQRNSGQTCAVGMIHSSPMAVCRGRETM